MFKVTKLLEGNEYVFRVMAVNKYGISEALESSPVIMKNPFVPPGSPQILDVTNITSNSMTVCWAAPETDGGSEIITYIIEKKDRTGIRWTKCNRQKVTDVCFRVMGLSEDHEYEFRVSAENAAGDGEPSLPTSYYKASNPKFKPGPPVNVHVIDTTKNSILIAWGKPLNDGGSEIQGYIVEICKAEDEEWTLCTPPTGLRVNKFEIGKLTENQEYKIQVCAINKMGVGEPTAIPGTAKPEDKMEAPELSLDSELRKGIVVRAGGSVRIKIGLRGRPPPEISWSKDEGVLSDKVIIEKSLNYTQLSMDNCDRNDTGKYIVKLNNSSGSVSEFVSVKVLDTPGAPLNFDVKDIKKDSVKWVRNGKEIDKSTAKMEVKTTVKRSVLIVKDCSKDDTGNYDITLSNVGGTKTIPIKVKVLDRPGPPVAPLNISGVTANSCNLSWNEPSQDGGAKVSHYIIEKRETSRLSWTLAEPKVELKENSEYNFRICAINSEGIGEPADIHGSVIAVDKAEAPEIELDADLRKVVSVRASGTLRLFVPIRGRPEPKVKWEKEDGSFTERVQVEATGSYTMLVIDNVNRFDSGKYILTLENKSGTKSEFINVRILDSPSAPINFAVRDVKKDSVKLLWEPPLFDGGAKITNYIVEKRESTRKAYTAVTNNCTHTSFVIMELQEGGIYYFRVRAVNEFGIGIAVETKDPVKVAQPPMPPGKVSVVDVTRNTATLSWEKPLHDGGSKIICYHVETQTKGSDKWNVGATVQVLEATITGLMSGEEYHFRVIAVNEKGKSEPQELGVPVIAKDVQIEPTINLLFNTYSVKAGKDLTIEVPFRGRPKPVVSWKKDGLPLMQTSSITILTSETSSKISFKETTRDHVGKYEIAVANTAGTKSAEIGVVVLDKPGPPSAMKVDEVTSESITLSWKPPEYDGGCHISSYIVEKRDTNTTVWETSDPIKVLDPFTIPSTPLRVEIANVSSEAMTICWEKPDSDGGSKISSYIIERREKSSMRWVRINKKPVTDNTFRATNLRAECEYEYRVFAENAAGLSPPSDPSPLTKAQDPRFPPSPPTKPKVVDSTKDSMSLVWNKPLSDGGSAVIGYSVEYKKTEDTVWAVAVPITRNTEFTVVGLCPGAEYVFRVKSISKIGVSDPSPTSEPHVAKEREEEPVFDVDIEMRKTMIVKHGNSFTLTVPFKGKPVPSVVWEKDDINLKERASIDTSDACTSLTAEKATRYDSVSNGFLLCIMVAAQLLITSYSNVRQALLPGLRFPLQLQETKLK
uniref:Titin-like n=1 Tax=Scleropages formosus TaxID=113540 RepID=A0A8C9S0T9_SCLFO